MKIKNLKRKCMILSLVLILAGALIATAGFGAMGFHYDHLKDSATADPWYQTIHIKDGSLSYGVDLGDNVQIMSIGYEE